MEIDKDSCSFQDMINYLNFTLVKTNIPFRIFSQSIKNKNRNEFELLVRYAKTLDVYNSSFISLLNYCALHGNDDYGTLKILIENNANLNYLDTDGWSALVYASDYEHEYCIKLLIENGANIHFNIKLLLYSSKSILLTNGELDCKKYIIEHM